MLDRLGDGGIDHTPLGVLTVADDEGVVLCPAESCTHIVSFLFELEVSDHQPKHLLQSYELPRFKCNYPLPVYRLLELV